MTEALGLEERRAIETLQRRLVGCPLCGRAGGAMAYARDYCHKCKAELDPSPLQQWAQATGFSLADLADLSGVPKPTIMRAARHARMSGAVAERLARVTGMPISVFTEGSAGEATT